MEFVTKCVFLGGHYVTQAGGEVIVTIIKGGINLHKNLTQKYDNMFRVIESDENILELLNAFTRNTNHDNVKYLHLKKENRKEIKSASVKSDDLNIHLSRGLQNPPISKYVQSNIDFKDVKNQNLISLNKNEIDNYKHLYRNISGTEEQRNKNLLEQQHEYIDSRKLIKKAFSQPNFLSNSVQFLSYEMLSLKTTRKEIINETSNFEASNDELLKEEMDPLEKSNVSRSLNYENDEIVLKSSASTSHEDILKQNTLKEKKSIREETISYFSENNKPSKNANGGDSIQLNIPCISKNLSKPQMDTEPKDESKLLLTNENETGLIKNEVEDISDTQTLTTSRESINMTTTFEGPAQLETTLEISNIKQSTTPTPINKKLICQCTHYATKSLSEKSGQETSLQSFPKPEYLNIFKEESSMLKAPKAIPDIEEIFPLSLGRNEDVTNQLKPFLLNETTDQISVSSDNKKAEKPFSKTITDFSVDSYFISTEKSDTYTKVFKVMKEMQLLTNSCVLMSVETEIQENDKANKDDILDTIFNKQRKHKKIGTAESLSEPHSLRNDFLTNESDENLSMKIKHIDEFENKQTPCLQATRDTYNLPNKSNTWFTNNTISKEEKSGRAIKLMEDEEIPQSIEDIISLVKNQTFPNAVQKETPILKDKKTEFPNVLQVTNIMKPHFFNHEILNTNKEKDSKSSGSTESKSQKRELHDNTYTTHKSNTHSNIHQLTKLKENASKSLTVKEFHNRKSGCLNANFTHEIIHKVFGNNENFNEVLNDNCLPKYQVLCFTRSVPKQILEEASTNAVKAPERDEFLTKDTDFLLRCKFNNFLEDCITECVQINSLQSSFRLLTMLPMKENLSKERQTLNVNNENQLFKEIPKPNEQSTSVGVQDIPKSDKRTKPTKLSTPNILNKEKTVYVLLHQYKNHKHQWLLKPTDKSEFKYMKLSTKQETCSPKLSGDQHQLIKRIPEKYHSKSIENQIQTSIPNETIPNLQSGLLRVDFEIKKVLPSKLEETQETGMLLALYLKNEIEMIIANQKAFYKLEQKITQYLIQQNMRLPDKNKHLNEITLGGTLKSDFSKPLQTVEETKLPKNDESFKNCATERHDDNKIIGKSILYIFFMIFLAFVSDQSFPLIP